MTEPKTQPVLRYVYTLVGMVLSVALFVAGFLVWVEFRQRQAHSISVQYHHPTIRLCDRISGQLIVFGDEEILRRSESLSLPGELEGPVLSLLPDGGDIERSGALIGYCISQIETLQDEFDDPAFALLVERLSLYRPIFENVSYSIELDGILELIEHVEVIAITSDQLERLHVAKDNAIFAEIAGFQSENVVALVGVGVLLLCVSVLGGLRLLRSIGDLLGERDAAHDSLLRSENSMRSIIEYAADGIITINDKGVIITFNVTAEKIFGYSEEEVKGDNVSCLMPEPDKGNHDSHIARYLDTGEKHIIGIRREVIGLRKDGSTFPMDLGVSDVQLGDRHIFTGIIRDLTEIKRIEGELHKLGKALDESSNQFYILDVDTMKLTYVNEGVVRALGYTKEELMAMTPMDIVSSHTEEQMFAVFRPLLAREVKEVSVEAEHTRKDGSTYPANTHTTYLSWEGKDYFLTVAEDITDRRRAEEERRHLELQIQQAQKLESLGVLAGGIAHDFNNLLVGILGNAALSLGELSPASPARESITQIETAATRAADLCRQMLAYSGKGKFVIRAVNVNEIVEEMTHLLEISISKKAVLKFNYSDNLPAVEVDLTQMRQIVMNLITNASEAIRDKSGVISLATGAVDCDRVYLDETYLDENLPEGAYVFIEVSDTGCGMDEETREKIFDPFFTTKFTGRGLGLAAVLGIIRGHNGAIKVYSELGRGTTFKVLLPAVDVPPESLDSDFGESGYGKGTGTVLLVDDEETVLTVGRRMLTKVGYDVLTAEDGREALDVFRREGDTIACVILDLTMPHMGGEETFRELRRLRADIPVILSSGYNEEEVTSRFSGKGLAGFVQKPYSLKTLAETIRKTLAE